MKRFLFKILFLFFLLPFLFFLFVVVSSEIIEKQHFENWETESNLFVFKPNSYYDILFVGNSHARNFTRHKNHQRVEKILDKSILNIGQTGNISGMSIYALYLKYFYSKNVKIDTIIMIVSSSMMYANYNNVASNTFEEEPINFEFINLYLKNDFENKYQRLFYYFRSKLSAKWLRLKPNSLDQKSDSLSFLDSVKVEKGFKNAFMNGFDTIVFNKNVKRIESFINIAQENNSTVMFISTPNLFGEWPKHSELLKVMADLHEKYNVEYYDFSNEIKDPTMYYDHHHLNTKGVVYFTENYLKDILE